MGPMSRLCLVVLGALVVSVSNVHAVEIAGVTAAAETLCDTMGYSKLQSRALLAEAEAEGPFDHAKGDAKAHIDAALNGPLFKVGVAVYPPFAFVANKEEEESGDASADAFLQVGQGETPATGPEWTGFSVDVWKSVAAANGWRTEFVNGTYDEVIKMMQDGKVDTIANGIFLTRHVRSRNPKWVFSSTFWVSGLAILVKKGAGQPPGPLDLFTSPQMWSTVGVFCLGLLGSGLVFWILERKEECTSVWMEKKDGELDGQGNPVMEFQAGEVPYGPEGILVGMWWSAATFTTVGYGDYAPKTVPGRVWGLLMMFASLFLVAMFTGAISSSMIIAAAGGPSDIHYVSDLDGRPVGVLKSSFPANFLRTHSHANVQEYNKVADAIEAMLNGEVDAVVGIYDTLLHHMTDGKGAGETVMAGQAFHQHALVFPFSSLSKSVALNMAAAKSVLAGNEKGAMGVQRIVSDTLLNLQDSPSAEQNLDNIINRYTH